MLPPYKVHDNGELIDLMVEPTNRCNLRCPTCFSHLDSREKRDMLFTDFRYIIDNSGISIRNMSLYNYGEPLLNPDIWRMVKYARDSGVHHVKIDTNGMLLDGANISSALSSGIDKISISLDGACQETYSKFRIGGSFAKVLSNIKELVRRRDAASSDMEIELQFIIMRHNQHELDAIRMLSEEIGVDILRFKRVLVRRKEWEYLLPDNKYSRYDGVTPQNTCNKPARQLVINSNGTVIPCCYIVGDDVRKHALGNAFKESLSDILSGRKYMEFLEACSSDKSALDCCRDCEEGNINMDYDVMRLR